MARVMICDDDRVMAEDLAAALRLAGHEAETCRHTMDMLREAAQGRFDLVVFDLEMVGFGQHGAIEVLNEVAPSVPLIALHHRPSEMMRGVSQSRLAAVLPRPVVVKDFMYAVSRALNGRLTFDCA